MKVVGVQEKRCLDCEHHFLQWTHIHRGIRMPTLKPDKIHEIEPEGRPCPNCGKSDIVDAVPKEVERPAYQIQKERPKRRKSSTLRHLGL